MSGLAEILEENARLRRELQDKETELARRDAMVEELKRKAEFLAHQLEAAQLRRTGPASERYIPDGQGLLPFVADIQPPPRDPVAETQSDEEVTEAPTKRKGTPRRRSREDVAHLEGVDVHCPAAAATCASCGGP